MKIEISEKEKQRADFFIQQHRRCVLNSTEGGKFTYEVTPTGLGNLVRIRCNACGKTRDITDLTTW